MNKLTTERRAAILRALVEGNSIRSVCRMTGAAKGTVLSLLSEIGYACHRFHFDTVRNVKVAKVQVDEIWSFCYCKEKNVEVARAARGKGAGSVWTFVGIDPDTKLAVSWYVGERNAEHAYRFMVDLASRLSDRVQMTTDAHSVYLSAVPAAFGNDIDYARLIKMYGPNPEPETRYSPPRCIGTRAEPVIGHPAFEDVCTSHVERQNLTMRMSMRRFTRLSNAFSKKLTNHRFAVGLHFVYYNWCRPHQTLTKAAGKPTTPAMAAGLAPKPMTVEELAELQVSLYDSHSN